MNLILKKKRSISPSPTHRSMAKLKNDEKEEKRKVLLPLEMIELIIQYMDLQVM